MIVTGKLTQQKAEDYSVLCIKRETEALTTELLTGRHILETIKLENFLNGNDHADYPGENKAERFKNFLFAHLDIFKAIKRQEPFNTLPLIIE